MTFGKAVEFGLKKGKYIYRNFEPHIQYDLDCGEALPVIWRYDENADELSQHHFTAEQVLVTDWEILQ